MDLYHIEDHSPGMVFWHPNGTKMVNALKDYIRGKIDRRGYQEVITPDSDARREQRTNSFVHCRADAGGDEVATRLCGSSPATPTSTTRTCSKVCKTSVATKRLRFGMTECSHGR